MRLDNELNLVPNVDKIYVEFGPFADIYKVVNSNNFYTLFITGLSGNGKTLMVEQACAKAKRKLVRVNITVETDEDDLFGGFRLVNGETQWYDGPVIQAMKEGAVLLLDEVDLASSRIMCLQPVLEGKPILLKKINQLVMPAKGFNVIATANTKGQGDEAGKFIGTNVLNEAFLERFSATIEHNYPSKENEMTILKKLAETHKIEDDTFLMNLVTFADNIRESFNNGSVGDVISTRRLVHIVNAFAIFQDKQKSVELCLNRFDTHTKQSFLELFQKIVEPPMATEEPEEEEIEIIDATEELPF